MVILLGWIGLSILAGIIGQDKNIGFAGSFFLSLFLSPFIGLLVAIFSKEKKRKD